MAPAAGRFAVTPESLQISLQSLIPMIISSNMLQERATADLTLLLRAVAVVQPGATDETCDDVASACAALAELGESSILAGLAKGAVFKAMLDTITKSLARAQSAAGKRSAVERLMSMMKALSDDSEMNLDTARAVQNALSATAKYLNENPAEVEDQKVVEAL
eukprot:2590058-Alexandrium_andersonii.AAC.1